MMADDSFGPLKLLLIPSTILVVSLYTLTLYQFLAIFAILLSIWFYWLNRKTNLPPGPMKLPIFGTLPLLLSKHSYEFADNCHKKYGPIVDISIGTGKFFTVSTYELIKELGLHPSLQLRPEIGLFAEFNKKLGIVSSEGELWKHQRRFVLQSLRDSGMGKLRMQDKIVEELSHVIGLIKKCNGQAMHIHSLMEKSTSNIIFALAFNKTFEYDDEAFIERIKALDENFKLIAYIGALSLFKWVTPFVNGIRNRIFQNVETMKSQSQEFIDEHLKTMDEDNPRDILDLYLMEIEKKGSKDEAYHQTFFMEQLRYVIIDLFAGGTETSSTTIRWGILYMIHHPDVQEKVWKEIEDVVGTERFACMDDKLNLPYTIATLQEIERMASVLPQSLPRRNGEDLTIKGYHVPEGSVMVYNTYTLHRDPSLWKNPSKFDPSRFIDENGKVFRPPYLMPFGSGKRVCPGESLAKMEIFLYFTSLMQNFKFEKAENESLPSMESPKGIIRAPTDYKVRCIPRN